MSVQLGLHPIRGEDAGSNPVGPSEIRMDDLTKDGWVMDADGVWSKPLDPETREAMMANSRRRSVLYAIIVGVGSLIAWIMIAWAISGLLIART